MFRRLASIALISCLALLSGGDPAASGNRAPEAAESVAVIRPLEVRTRKLHMVRPDLLRFPMQYDVCC